MQTNAKKWHVENWGVYGWAETAVKGVGIVAGISAGIAALSSGNDLMIGDNPRLAALIVGVLATFLPLGALYIRFQQREIISMVYAIFNFVAHAGMLLALLRIPTTQQGALIVFGIAFVLGELIKQRWLAVTGYTEMGQSRTNMSRISWAVTGLYILFVIFMLI